MKKIVLLLLLSSCFFSCQDEFCASTTTPHLVVRFYNKDTPNKTKNIQLVVWANDKAKLFNGQIITTDSLILPLDTQKNSVTYHFSKQNEADPESVSVEDLVIKYNTKDTYISKSCGFKSTFNNVSITNTNKDWLKSQELTTTTITNENNAHVKIFH